MVAVAIVGLNLYAPAEPTLLQRTLASALVGLCAVPSIMWASRRPWRQSLMPYVGVLYATSFAMPVFVRQDFVGAWSAGPLVDGDAINDALVLALGGWCALMLGYFALARPRPLAVWPAIAVLPRDDAKLAKMVAVVAGVAAMPFLYLDNAAAAAQYAGETLLPDAVAFPVKLAGQFVVFAMLVLFHLHLRCQLGAAGRVFMAALAIYYTVLGFSTGMLNHGIKAVFALFMAYAVAAPTPTWRGIAYGALAAAVLVFVLLPARMDYRRMIWTHAVGPYSAQRIAVHRFEREEQVLQTTDYSATLRNRVIAFAHNDPSTCQRQPAQPQLTVSVFVHPFSVDDLPARFRQRGHQVLGFSFADGVVENGRCVASVRLPDYPTTAIRAALLRVRTIVAVSTPVYTPFGKATNPGAPKAHDSFVRKTALYAANVAAAFDAEFVSRAGDLSTRRLDHLLPLAWLIEHVPDPIPYLGGETYAPLLHKLVPRIVFPDKPRDVDDLGARHGFVPPNSMRNFKVHQLGEFYVNFGAAGVLAGLFALGLLYRVLHELFHRHSACVATMAAGTHMLTVLALEMESVLSISLGFLMWYAMAMVVLGLAVRAALRLRRPSAR